MSHDMLLMVGFVGLGTLIIFICNVVCYHDRVLRWVAASIGVGFYLFMGYLIGFRIGL